MNAVNPTLSREMSFPDIKKNMKILGKFKVGDKPLMSDAHIKKEDRVLLVFFRRWYGGALDLNLLEKTFQGAYSILEQAKKIGSVKQKEQKEIAKRAQCIQSLIFGALCGVMALWETYHNEGKENAERIVEIVNRVLPRLMKPKETFYPDILDRFKIISDVYSQEGKTLAQQLHETYKSYDRARVVRYRVVKIPAYKERKVPKINTQSPDVKPVPRVVNKEREEPEQMQNKFFSLFQKSLSRIRSSRFKLKKSPHQHLPKSTSDSHIHYFNTKILMRARGLENKTRQLSDFEVNASISNDDWEEDHWGNDDEYKDVHLQYTGYIPLTRKVYLPSRFGEEQKEADPKVRAKKTTQTTQMSREDRAREAEKILAKITSRRSKYICSSSSEESDE